ncbi:MAG: hypothetical protein N3F62_01095 [Bacteroidia bacterium]|jgi:hypothetical protein|nr:hypothetical protein [Bacteroidia bacterium]
MAQNIKKRLLFLSLGVVVIYLLILIMIISHERFALVLLGLIKMNEIGEFLLLPLGFLYGFEMIVDTNEPVPPEFVFWLLSVSFIWFVIIWLFCFIIVSFIYLVLRKFNISNKIFNSKSNE